MSCEPIITNGTNPRLHGSALLALDVICPRGTSIPGQYEMFGPQTSLNMTSATSLRVLEVGPSPYGLPDTESCHVGQDRHHASHSLLPASSADLATKGTSRPSGLTSSRSAVLQSSLGSRLRTRLGMDGSTIYSMRWKNADTPAGRQYCQLVASARRISVSGCSSERSGWPTPVANPANGTPEAFLRRKRESIARGELYGSLDKRHQYGSATDGLAHSDTNGRNARREIRSVCAEHDAEHGCPACGLAHSDNARPQRWAGMSERADEQPPGPRGVESGSANPNNSFWSGADWLGCRDGKFRPVEPGTQPLAHGLPARVGRLRGYGNAIVPQVAATFIKEFLGAAAEIANAN